MKSNRTFRQPEITDKQWWYRVSGDCGAPTFVRAALLVPKSYQWEDVTAALQHCTAHTRIDAIELIEGYGARYLSAPGYIGCTAWGVYGSAQEAAQALADEYGTDKEGVDLPCEP